MFCDCLNTQFAPVDWLFKYNFIVTKNCNEFKKSRCLAEADVWEI